MEKTIIEKNAVHREIDEINFSKLIDSEILLDKNARKILAQKLSEVSEPLLGKILLMIKPIIIDFIIEIRKELLNNTEIMTIKKASHITNIPIPTLYTWISAGLLGKYYIGEKTYVSLTEIQYIYKKKHPVKYKEMEKSLKTT